MKHSMHSSALSSSISASLPFIRLSRRLRWFVHSLVLMIAFCAALQPAVASVAKPPATSSGEWVWMGGSSTVPSSYGSLPGVYGTYGTPAAGNIPGSRDAAASWTDRSGHFWLFAGYGYDANNTLGFLNDLWELNPSTGQWAWMSGSSTAPCNDCGQPGVYGALGIPAAGNIPGSREQSASWTDSSGHFWLFGGIGYDANGIQGSLNDLWEFNPSTNQWTWMGGSSTVPGADQGQPGIYGELGTSAAGNVPGGRLGAIGWLDHSGNLWLFGGLGFDAIGQKGYLNDLWEFNPAVNQWTWMSGSSAANQHGEFGTLEVSAAGNVPGGRQNDVSWTDSSGHLWLFGGYGYDASSGAGLLNDLWEFNPSTNQWAWMGGSNAANQAGVYGSLGIPAAGNTPGGQYNPVSWTDSSGQLWLFGGYGYDASGTLGFFNHLWEFNPSTNQWTWMGGSSAGDQAAVYGALGVPAAANVPGGREVGGAWTDSIGNFWIFGGAGYDANGTFGYPVDLWEYQPSAVSLPAAATPNFSLAGGTYFGSQVVTISEMTPGATIYYTTDGSTPTAASTIYDGPITVAYTETLKAIATASGYSNSAVAASAYTIAVYAPTTTTLTSSPNPSSFAQLVTFTATVTSQYSGTATGTVTFSNQSTALGTATVNGGVAVFATLTLQQGTDTITAVYSGDANFAASTSNTLSQAVTAALPGSLSGEWVWMGGSSTINQSFGGQAGVYGTLGISAAANIPGSRDAAVSWTDSSGNFWFFGGYGFDANGTRGSLNDLWKFNSSTNQWTWMGGSSTVPTVYKGQPGVYGTLGTPAAGNIPGGRLYASGWTDSSGNFWLFGGAGYDADGNSNVLNDLWKFTPSTNQWTWMSGNSVVGSAGAVAGIYGTLGTPAAGNIPGGRQVATSWIDSSGHLWLFGGWGWDDNGTGGALNDLWEFNPVTNLWTWMGGSRTLPGENQGQPGVYGTLGTPAYGNIPGGRVAASGWTDRSGKFWLFGGGGYQSGANANSYEFNDLWEFDPATNQWAWMGGSSSMSSTGSQPGVYGLLGTPTAGNIPGSRYAAEAWTDPSGNFWMFGGGGLNGNGSSDFHNDLWEFSPVTNLWTWMGGNSMDDQPGAYGLLGVSAAGDIPGSRSGAASWTDRSGNLWLFGGEGYDASGYLSILNDLWEYQPSTVIVPVSSTTTLASALNPSVFGQPATFFASVTSSAGAPPDGETVLFASGTTILGTGTLRGGTASFTTSTLPTGVDSIFAIYTGDAIHNGSFSNPISQTVGQASSTTTLTSSPNPFFVNQGVTVTVTVAGVLGGTPTGLVTLFNGTAVLGYGTLNNGAAVLLVTNLPQGTDTVTAVYGGDANFVGSTSNALSEVIIPAPASPQPGLWTWIGGSDLENQPGVYGALGTPAAGNNPGNRVLASSWTDKNGHFWLFGGKELEDTGCCVFPNDLWEFSPSTNQWTWMGGNSVSSQAGEYGTLGVPASTNIPGSRMMASNWTDSSGNLWLFGGAGFDANGNYGHLNDLWEFNPITNQWTWMSGSSTGNTLGEYGPYTAAVYGTLGVPTAGNIPGGRESAVSWIDSSGHPWLFGGLGYDSNGVYGYLNDLWEFNPSTNLWAWMGGGNTVPGPEQGNAGVYGTLGISAAGNIPGGRESAVSWTDNRGHVWLFGGSGADASGSWAWLNDLWEFNPSTNQWAWVNGSSTVPAGGLGQAGIYNAMGAPAAGNVPGGRGLSTAWTDSIGRFWLFGGQGIDSGGEGGDLNDLWVFDASTNQWTWMSGNTFVDQPGIYGFLGTSAAGNSPGARLAPASWIDNSGNLWLFGGNGFSNSSNFGNLNDLWRFQPFAVVVSPTAAPTFSIAAGSYTSPQTVIISDPTPSATIFYTTDGTKPTITSTVYSGPIAVSSTETLKAIATAVGYTTSAVAKAVYSIRVLAPAFSPNGGTFTAPQTVTLSTATSGASIHYTTDGSTPSATAGTLYTGPITVSANTTIKAIAFGAGLTNSAVSSATYKFKD
ncbi:MAG: kelch repeat-containing protein [Terracidiphilus sp.]